MKAAAERLPTENLHVRILTSNHFFSPHPELQKALEERIVALEKSEGFKVTQSEVQKVQAKCLQQLRDVKAALEKDGGNAASAAQTKAIMAEKEALQKKVAKLEYRVQHLVESMEFLYEKAKASSSS